MTISSPLRGTPRQTRTLALLGVSLLALGSAESARAGGPQGGTVVRGTAEIARSAARTTIRQSSQRAVIDWRRFDVGRDHTVTFSQPGRDAATLNRVITAEPSLIEGAVRAPGTVLIQNGAGVVFSGTSRVDTGGLVATSQAVDAERFQRDGGLTIGGGERAGARVVNEGRITVGGAGLAALVGGDVENAGAIVAERGTVALAGGTRTTLDLTGDGLLRIAVDGDGKVTNRGTLDVGSGRVVLTAAAAAGTLDAAINTSGVIRARSGSGKGGTIELTGQGGANVRISGRLDADRPSGGGAITVTGSRIDIEPGARISATGRDGGSIRIGGDRQGTGPLRRADAVALAASASVTADGTTGRGGEIVLWSDGLTQVDGTVSATGGGFVETSGLDALALGPTASVTAGLGGFWLLDPRDVVITNVSGAGPIGPGTVNPPPGSGDYTVSLTALQNALNAGSDVTITTVQPASSGYGDIILARQLSWTGTGNLTLLADRNLSIEAGVATARGDFTATAARNLDVGANMTATGDAAIALTAIGGNLLVGRSSAGDIAVTTERGALSIAAPRGQVAIKRVSTHGGGIQVDASEGTLDITAGTGILVQGGARGQWVRVGTETSASAVTLAAPDIDVLAGPGDFAEVVTGAGGALDLRAEDITLRAQPGAQARIAARDGGTLTLEADRQTWDGAVESGRDLSDGGDVRLSGAIIASVRPVFSLAAGADFTLDAGSSYTSALGLGVTTSGSGQIDIGGPVTAAQVTLVAQERVRLGADAAITGTASGAAVVVAAGRHFETAAGPGALSAPDGRWLLYIDSFAGADGTLPTPGNFDLYGRSYAGNPPAVLGYGGNRIVWGERPVLTLTAETLRKTYGETAAPGYATGGLRPGDSLGTALASGPNVTSNGAPARASAQSYATRMAATASGQGYVLVLVNGTLTVDPATLTITADDARRRYGAANPSFAGRIDGFLPGDDTSLLDGTLTFATNASAASPVGAYAIAPSGLTDPGGNYAIAYVPGTLTVDPAPLTVTAIDTTRRYGGINPAFRARYDGLVLGEDANALAGTLRITTPASAGSPVGSYTLTPGGLTSGNYAITFAPGTLTVDPAPLTITAADATRLYGGATPPFRARYDGFVLGEDAGVLAGELRFTTPATAGSSVGRYSVTPDGLTGGNYAITFVPGNLTVHPAPLTITANDVSRRVGEPDPELTVRYDGFVLGEGAGVLGGRLRFSTVAHAGSPVGSYRLSAAGLTGGNYAIRYVAGTFTIDPAAQPQTPSAAPSTGGAYVFARGVPPLTPGDASFRTTVAEAPPALANPFDLTYSLGEVVQLAPTGSAGAAAAPADDTQGFVPAAGGLPAAEEAPADPTCSGSISRGDAACGRRTVEESYWTAQAGALP